MKRLPYILSENARSAGHAGVSAIEELPYVSSTSHIRVRKYWRYIFVGVILLSKVFLIMAVYFFVQYQHFRKLQESVMPMEAPKAVQSVSLKKS